MENYAKVITIMNILVSGVASDIGMGIGRILKILPWIHKLYGIDIKTEHAGMFIFDQCDTAPRADNIEYLAWLESYIANNNISLFIPSSEAEISRITDEGIKSIGGALVITTNDYVIKNSLDKHKCLSVLSENGIIVPKHGLVGDATPKQFPVIVKPRSGQGSKNVIKINTEKEFLSLDNCNLVWQEYLEPDDQEYTCPVFYSEETGIRILIIKRELQGGFTHKGEIVDNEDIYKYVYSIAQALQLDGLMNVQLRLTSSGPKLFEINPRISSTVVFRHKMGFCDLVWLLQQRLGKEISNYQPPKVGTQFYRGIQEYITNSNL